jgi:hypothetical protein
MTAPRTPASGQSRVWDPVGSEFICCSRLIRPRTGKPPSMDDIALAPVRWGSLAPCIGPDRMSMLVSALDSLADRLGGRPIWNLSSTAAGGGVAEMLHTFLGYAEAGGVATRWLTIEGDDRFFHLTKQLHRGLHGVPTGLISAEDADHYRDVMHANLAALGSRVARGATVRSYVMMAPEGSCAAGRSSTPRGHHQNPTRR